MSLVSDALRFLLTTDVSTRDLKLRLAKALGIDEKSAAAAIIRAKAEAAKQAVAKAGKKTLFLPQCLRSKACKAPLDENGYRCNLCREDCTIATIKRAANDAGMQTYIAPGGAIVRQIIQREKPEAVIGVACIPEIELGLEFCEKACIPAIGIPLLKDGCVATIVDVGEVLTILRYCNGSRSKSKEGNLSLGTDFDAGSNKS